MYSISFVNNKGGCGKTTSIFQIAGVLAERHKRVLVIDLDGQCNATSTLLGNSSMPSKTVLDVLSGSASPDEAIAPALYVARGCRNLSEHGVFCLAGDSKLLDSDTFLLVDDEALAALRTYAESFDYVLVDMPPSNSGANRVGFRLTDNVLIPMTSSDIYATSGYSKIEATINAANDDFNPSLRIIGVYFSNYIENPMQSWVSDSLLASCAKVMLTTKIPHSSAVAISTVNCRPLVVSAATSKAAEAYRNLTTEIENVLKVKGA